MKEHVITRSFCLQALRKISKRIQDVFLSLAR
jgi:hypothetical protein